MGNTPARLDGVLHKLMSSMGLARRWYGWQVVVTWPEIVGPQLAEVSRALRFAEGVLTVVVEKDVWRQELEMQMDDILARVHEHPGGKVVDRIVLKAGSMRKESDGKDCDRT